MIYGLYLSAGGVMANTHRIDVISNNLANSETAGFKRDVSLFQEALTEARKLGVSPRTHSNPMLEALGGGVDHQGTAVDLEQGAVEASSNPYDLAINGKGFFAVRDRQGEIKLTRDGRLMRDREGSLSLASGAGQVLDQSLTPISLNEGPIQVNSNGNVMQNGQFAARIGVFDVENPRMLAKDGRSLLKHPQLAGSMRAAPGQIQQNAIEASNADPTTELTSLLEAQRQLEANANMIRFQDQTLARLVNDVAKIG